MGSLKSIYEIVTGNYKFIIPSYQRGYRWTGREVEDLLEDILDFWRQSEGDRESFYCLQPLVVKKDEGKSKEEGKNVYRVVDGQQRLTTILLTLKALEKIVKDEYGIKEFYEIDYEIRPGSKNFLAEINRKSEDEAKENIDYWHMYKAYETGNNWIKEKTINRVITGRQLAELLLGYTRKKDIKFIWYEISEDDEIKLFTRLNIGKIPLTNSELIKALFLLPLKSEDEKALLISKWDNIEAKLQDNRFWGFIYGDKHYRKPTRIDILFELVADDENIEEVKQAKERLKHLRKDDERRSFYIFYEALRNKEKDKQQEIIEEIWRKVKYYFRILEEFYEDNEFYHLIGYMVNMERKEEIRLNKIIQAFQEKDRKDFKEFLRNEIKRKLGISKNELEVLSYSDNKDKIKNVLLLFNVVLTMNANKNLEDEMYLRFPFHLHKSQKWSLEHINPRSPEDLNKKEEIRELLNEYKNDEEIDGNLRQEIQEALNEDDERKLKEVIKKLFEKYSPDEGEKDSLGNLTLLSDELNKKLQNRFFYKKRKIIMEEEKRGTYIPLGTKYVFMKYPLEGSRPLVVWDKSDMEEYLNFIEETLKDFLKEEIDEQQ